MYNLAPSYVPIERFQLGALLARDTSASMTLSGLQAKWIITPKQENGCNTGAVQLDGSVGRRGGASLYTLGTKLQF